MFKLSREKKPSNTAEKDENKKPEHERFCFYICYFYKFVEKFSLYIGRKHSSEE